MHAPPPPPGWLGRAAPCNGRALHPSLPALHPPETTIQTTHWRLSFSRSERPSFHLKQQQQAAAAASSKQQQQQQQILSVFEQRFPLPLPMFGVSFSVLSPPTPTLACAHLLSAGTHLPRRQHLIIPQPHADMQPPFLFLTHRTVVLPPSAPYATLLAPSILTTTTTNHHRPNGDDHPRRSDVCAEVKNDPHAFLRLGRSCSSGGLAARDHAAHSRSAIHVANACARRKARYVFNASRSSLALEHEASENKSQRERADRERGSL